MSTLKDMSIQEFDYWHQDRHVNPQHLESVAAFHRAGIKDAAGHGGGLGVEIEHLPVRTADNPVSAPEGTAVTYAEAHGIRSVLEDLRELYDPAEEVYEGDALLGLGKEGIRISLEPGGQIECSFSVVYSAGGLERLYADFLQNIGPALRRHGVQLVTQGYQPHSLSEDIDVIPRKRYQCMDAYFGRMSGFGRNMMRASASVQISIDYFSEEDAVAKMRTGTALGPVLAYFFRNSPYFEGQASPYRLLRQHFWTRIGNSRAGVTPGLFDGNFGFEQAAYNVLASPLMVADVTQTPEYAQESDPVRIAAFDNAADVYPDRALNDYEISHIISTHFNDVRLKNFIELRHWDSLPIGRTVQLLRCVAHVFYDREAFTEASSYVSGIREVDVEECKLGLQVYGDAALPYGRPLDFWRRRLGLDRDGTYRGR